MVEKLAHHFRESPHLVLTGFAGLTVSETTELRRRVRRVGGSYRVLKNRLAKRAAAGTPAELVVDRLQGPRAVATHKTDPVALAKTLYEFSREHPQLELVAGVVDGRERLEGEALKALAVLPGLPELRAKLLAVLQAPAATLVRLLQTPAGQLARVLDARRERLEGSA